ncbi:glucose-1-phosphate adenylyltransferase [Leptotrichia sp. OH3620_COT-345]|uniref:glucose-1-phosphate adenylyltransferase n=1 Tax=Leptotrichia sp. OH3620_COT-345 TaxID=2491048 RepID=UPI000F64CF61|nr:glucose-1-phosphate adenylyltransferase [Leptotrichia sp. OH3620_COT-345]RRD39138.1 glucose-1-phosphate adenylyltransferase [Leptotrichia sp. OH3620_COT-345]
MEILAMILAGGRGSRLDILSEKRVKPSVPFAGKFRIIDFALSNCSNSGIYDVALLTQYLPLSLNEHIGSGKPWDFDRRDSSITMLQPHEKPGGNAWYLGTADAIRQNVEFIKGKNPKYVLILSGDHIYKMNYNWMLEDHKRSNAELTIAVQEVPLEEAGRFGIFEVDESKKILNFEEKPKDPKSNLASMGIYIFNTDVLLEYLKKLENEDLDFGKHVIPSMIEEERKVFVHTYDSYWMDVGTYDSYLDANLDLIKKSEEVGINLYDQEWKIYTRSEDLAPVRIGVTGSVLNSLICDGCKIEGRVENSVLGPGVTIRKGSTIKNSIIFSGSYIDENTHLDTIILDKRVYVGKNSLLGHGDDYTPNKAKPDLLTKGISVIGKRAHLPDGSVIGRNVRIFGGVTLNDINKIVNSGETLEK